MPRTINLIFICNSVGHSYHCKMTTLLLLIYKPLRWPYKPIKRNLFFSERVNFILDNSCFKIIGKNGIKMMTIGLLV